MINARGQKSEYQFIMADKNGFLSGEILDFVLQDIDEEILDSEFDQSNQEISEVGTACIFFTLRNKIKYKNLKIMK